MICFRPSAFIALILFFPALVFGDSREALITAIDGSFKHNREIALNIWELAELGYLEVQSSALLQETLTAEGFRLEAGVPTAFIAEAGAGNAVLISTMPHCLETGRLPWTTVSNSSVKSRESVITQVQ